MSDKDRVALLAGEAVGGQFQVAGHDDVVPGVLRWSAEAGAALELINEASGFPRAFGGPRFQVYGELRNGAEVTLHDCLLRRLVFFDQPTRVSSSTLAFGAHVLAETRWGRATYSTAALSEWRNDSGIHLSWPAPRKRPSDFRVEFKQPSRDLVALTGGSLTFAGQVATSPVGHRPDFWMRTTAVMVVDVNRPQTIAGFMSRYAQPLRTLMTLVADRPDDLTREVYLDPANRRRVEVWRRGRIVQEREWNFRYLLVADQLVDYAAATRAWWRLHRRVWPALDLFGDHINEGTSYSPGRFLTVFSAIERYGDVRLGTTDLKRLRAYGEIDSAITGCTNNALDLIGVTRGYVAHFNNVGAHRRAEVEGNILASTRRLAALMQSCLLRNLGIKKALRQEIMEKHYAAWPLT